MRYKLAIFDFDGTLADSFPFFLQVVNTLADRHGFARVAAEDVESMRQLPVAQVIRMCGLSAWKLPRVGYDFRAMMRNSDSVHPFEGATRMLAQLHARGIQLGVISSNTTDNIQRVLGSEAFALFRHVDGGSALFGKRPRIRSMLRRLRIAPEHAIYVGDQDSDGRAARAAGVAFGAVGWGYSAVASLRRCEPEHEFTHFDEIVRTCAP